MKINRYQDLRVAFLFENEIANQAVTIAEKIAKKAKLYFVIDNRKYIPHITIYNTDFPVENIKKLFDSVEKIALKHKPFKIRYKKAFDLEGWVGVEFIKSQEISDIKKEILNKLNSLRNGHFPDKYLERWETLSNYEKKVIKKYGYINANSKYFPHLGLLRYQGTNKIDYTGFINNEFDNIEIKHIAITETAEHGTVTRILKKYKLVS